MWKVPWNKHLECDDDTKYRSWTSLRGKLWTNHCLNRWKWKSLSPIWLFATPLTMQLWNSPGQNTGMGSLSLIQGIFPTQGSNPGLPHCSWILYQLSHKGSPRILEWVAYPFSCGSFQPRNQTRVSQGLLHSRKILYLLSYQGSPSKETGKTSILVYVIGERLIQNNMLIHNLIRQWYRNWVGDGWIAVLFWTWSQKKYHLNWDPNRERKKKGLWGKLDPKPGINLVDSKQNICIHTMMKQNDEA